VKYNKTELADRIFSLDWECSEEETNHLTHGIHRYSGKFIPQIALQAVNLLTEPGDVVVDPYCGSGTTLLECATSGRYSIGLDLSPLAILISRVKTTLVEPELIETLYQRLFEKLAPVLNIRKQQLSLFDNPLSVDRRYESAFSDWRMSDSWYQKWFQNDVLLELILIHNAVLEESDFRLMNIGLVALSDILRKSSNANSSYPNVMYDKNKKAVKPALPIFFERLREICKMVISLKDSYNNICFTPNVVRGNARNLPISNMIDAVITHPPYIASIPYAEYGALSLTWLGYDSKKLDNNLTGGRRTSNNVVSKFTEGYNEMIQESWRILKPGGFMFLLVGNPTVKGQVIDLSELSTNLARDTGFELWVTHSRKGVNRRANRMGYETLLFFNKPT